MSLVGTRPPTVDEWEQYELHHRSRMSTKPGITGMWQVSGRSDITDFEEVVRLDTEYMDNRMYSEHAYQSDPEGDESSADIILDEVGLCKGQKFALHYDFGDDWMFTITVSKISEVQEDFEPRVIKSKGTIQQYPDWDEEDFDEE